MVSMTDLAKRVLATLVLPLSVYLIFLVLTLALGKAPYGSNSLAIGLMLQSSVLTVVVALALGLNLMSGRFDFSIGSAMILSAIIGGNFAVSLGLGPWGLLAACVVSAVVLGLVTAVLYVSLRLPFIVVSLALVLIEEALTTFLFEGKGVMLYGDDSLTAFARNPLLSLVLVVVLALFWFVTTHTRLGYQMRSLTNGQELAVKIGVKEPSTIVLTTVLAGVLVGAAATLYVCIQGSARPASNMGSTMYAFAAVTPVIVGFYLARFSNVALGIVVGTLSMSLLQYGLVAIDVNATLQTVLGGLFLIGFVAFTTWHDRAHQRRTIV